MRATVVLARPRLLRSLRRVACLDALPLRPYHNATTFLTLPILRGQLVAATTLNGLRNTLPLSSALFARRSSLAHTIYAPIFAPIQTRDHLSVLYVARRSLASMIASDMKACIRAKRSSFAEVSSATRNNGAVVVGSRVPMHLVAISGRKLDACASNLCWTKKPLSDRSNGQKSMLSDKCRATRAL